MTHEKQPTLDFHHQLKGALKDALDERIIISDPTRKVVIKGKTPRPKKDKYLNQFDLQKLLDSLELTEQVSFDWLILLIAKTGLRFSEALALTPEDFNLFNQTISVTKTWNYKTNEGGFMGTKNASSKRYVSIDWKTGMQFAQLIKDLPDNEPIFVKERVFNSTVNNLLRRCCKKTGIPIITVHGLRHTHASLLLFFFFLCFLYFLFSPRNLGHANMTTTQQIYLHIIQELENQDNDKIMRYLSGL